MDFVNEVEHGVTETRQKWTAIIGLLIAGWLGTIGFFGVLQGNWKGDVGRAEANLESAQSESIRLKGIINELSHRIQQQERQIDEDEAELHKFAVDLIASDERVLELKAINLDLSKRLESLAGQLRSADSELEVVRAELNNAEAKFQTLDSCLQVWEYAEDRASQAAIAEQCLKRWMRR